MKPRVKGYASVGLTSAIIAAGLGCHSGEGILGVDRCANIPCGAIPAPPRSHLCEWQRAQVAAASADLGTFYQADFIDTSDQLGPSANRQVLRLAHPQAVDRIAVILEPSDDPQRDAARAVSLASAFTLAGVRMSPEQVRIAYPAALGLDGLRAQPAVRQGSRSGAAGGSEQGGSAQSGFGGGGFGGGGVF